MKRTWGTISFYSATASAVVLFTGVASAPQAFGADPLSTRVQELEQQLEQMQAEVRRLKQEAREPSAQVHKLDDRMNRVEESVSKQAEVTPVMEVQELEERVARVERVEKYKNNTIFFRGGYTEYLDDTARGFESFTDTHNTIGLAPNPGLGHNAEEGWYVGGAIEHSITTDLWGLLPGTEALGEISLEYKNFGTERQTIVVPTAECGLVALATNPAPAGVPGLAGCVVQGDIALTMFTVSAAPKIKFLEGGPLRPWIIPAGLDFHVISPPSDSATYLDVGVQFAAGLEYEVIPGIVVGIDGRYHLTANYSNSENNFTQVTGVPGNTDHEFDFWTAGGYAGFRF
ncbi:MAG: hypothetical protein ACREX4_09505 [Gammaproteobacteria bacterium]